MPISKSFRAVADVGIVGGGQLARMTAERAAKLGVSVAVLDPAADCPAAAFAVEHVRGAFDDPRSLRRLVERCDLTTLDIEKADAAELARLEDLGHRILPRPAVLATIQDKLTQRRFLAEHGLPVPRFADLPDASLESMLRFGFPLVQKVRRGGYDGRGVAVLRDRSDWSQRLHGPSMVEERVSIDRELAVLVARGLEGEIDTYPVVELFPDPSTHVLDALVFPADLEETTARDARRLAERAIEALDGVGIFAVELFLDTAGKLWINEISPRPHNAGHVTIEAAATCQFEQHLRAILGLPLGDTGVVRPAAMANLLGPDGVEGPARIDGLDDALEVPGVRLHLYGKATVRPGRKMGHLTALDDDPSRALARVREARARIRFTTRDEVAA
jgi:5-(carboxyamino)imidazole ribonucleotide synthase